MNETKRLVTSDMVRGRARRASSGSRSRHPLDERQPTRQKTLKAARRTETVRMRAAATLGPVKE